MAGIRDPGVSAGGWASFGSFGRIGVLLAKQRSEHSSRAQIILPAVWAALFATRMLHHGAQRPGSPGRLVIVASLQAQNPLPQLAVARCQ